MPTSVREQALAGLFGVLAGSGYFKIAKRLVRRELVASEFPALFMFDGAWSDTPTTAGAGSGYGIAIRQEATIVVLAQPANEDDAGTVISAAVAAVQEAAGSVEPYLIAPSLSWIQQDGGSGPDMLQESGPPTVAQEVHLILHVQGVNLRPFDTV